MPLPLGDVIKRTRFLMLSPVDCALSVYIPINLLKKSDYSIIVVYCILDNQNIELIC